MLGSFEQMTAKPQPSTGSKESLEIFSRLTRGRLSPTLDSVEVSLPLERTRLAALDAIRSIYSFLAPWIGGSSVLALVAAIGLAIPRRRMPYCATLSVALLGSLFALVIIVALVDCTSFPAVNTGYLAGGYGPWLLLMFTGWLAAAEALPRKSGEG